MGEAKLAWPSEAMVDSAHYQTCPKQLLDPKLKILLRNILDLWNMCFTVCYSNGNKLN